MRHRLLWLLLIGIVVALLVLIAATATARSARCRPAISARWPTRSPAGFPRRHGPDACFASGSPGLTAALLWVVVGLVLVVGYSYRFELHEVADRVLAELIPGHVISHGRTVEVARANGGDFAIAAQINGARVPMVLDTGASSVVLTPRRCQGRRPAARICSTTRSRIDTANGRTRAAPVTLDRIAIGGLEERSIEALVAQPGQLEPACSA